MNLTCFTKIEFEEVTRACAINSIKMEIKLSRMIGQPCYGIPQDIKAITTCKVDMVYVNEEDVAISHADIQAFSFCSSGDKFDSLHGRIQSLQRVMDLFKAQGRTLDPKMKDMLKSMKDGLKKRK